MKYFYFLLLIIITSTAIYSCNVTVNVARKKPCEGKQCQNQGVLSHCKCDCPPGFGGEFCEKYLTCEVLSPLCPFNSTCEMLNGELTCICNSGYAGTSCDMLIIRHYTTGNSVYKGFKKCGDNVVPCEITMRNGAKADEIILENFIPEKPDVRITAKITGMYTFIFPEQTPALWGSTIKSLVDTNGTLYTSKDSTSIAIPYETIDNKGVVNFCTLELVRQ